MRKDVVLILWLACFFFGLKGHAQVVHQWQLNSFNWSEKPAYKPISSGEICRLNIQQDSLYLTLIDQEGATSFEKVYSELTSDPKFIEGFDDRTNACLAILYTNTNGWLNQFNLEVFYNADSTLFNIVKPTSNGAYWKPIDLYYDGKDYQLAFLEQKSDSTSIIRWYKANGMNGNLIDSFATNINEAITFEKASFRSDFLLVSANGENGLYNWLLNLRTKQEKHWQWNFENTSIIGSGFSYFTNRDQILSIQHSHTDTSKTNALLVLSDTNQVVKWVVEYNSEYNLTDSILSCAFYEDHIYLAGFVQKDSVNRDYLILSLDSLGNILWDLRYDGPGLLAVDVGISVTVDELGDIYFTGCSTVDSISSVFSAEIDMNANILWESSSDVQTQNQALEIISRNGSIYLSGRQLSNNLTNYLVHYKDSLKLVNIQKLHLEMIAYGLTVINGDTLLKDLLWNKFSRQYDFRRVVSLPGMQNFMLTNGVDLYKKMNALINRQYALDRKSPTVEMIVNSFRKSEYHMPPFLHFPYLNSLSRSAFLYGKTPIVYAEKWQDGEQMQPCFECPDLELIIPGNISDFVGVALDPNNLNVGLVNNAPYPLEQKVLLTCICEKLNDCIFCDEYPTSVPSPSGQATQNHEIEITLAGNEINLDDVCDDRIDRFGNEEKIYFTAVNPNPNQEIDPIPGYVIREGNYPSVSLRAIGNSKYYVKSLSNNK